MVEPVITVNLTSSFISWLSDEMSIDYSEADDFAQDIVSALYINGCLYMSPVHKATPALLAACEALKTAIEEWSEDLSAVNQEARLALLQEARKALAAACPEEAQDG